jgi:hypothetical protein
VGEERQAQNLEQVGSLARGGRARRRSLEAGASGVSYSRGAKAEREHAGKRGRGVETENLEEAKLRRGSSRGGGEQPAQRRRIRVWSKALRARRRTMRRWVTSSITAPTTRGHGVVDETARLHARQNP